MHAAKLTFQALRIHLNDEFGELRRGMRAACELLGDNGRLGLLTWKHSECAIVVDVFKRIDNPRAIITTSPPRRRNLADAPFGRRRLLFWRRLL